MSLRIRVAERVARDEIAAEAVAEAEAAVRERSGFRGASAQLGLETINRLRPGFLKQHVWAMLPQWAAALDEYWEAGEASGDQHGYLVARADNVTESLLEVSDAYVGRASDPKAIAVYHQLRPRAPKHIAAQMPRIATFVARHAHAV